MIPMSPVKVEVDADHSCNNWRCCFGCKCCKKITPISRSPVSVEITERVTRTYERHHHHHHHGAGVASLILPTSPALVRLSNGQRIDNIEERKEDSK